MRVVKYVKGEASDGEVIKLAPLTYCISLMMVQFGRNIWNFFYGQKCIVFVTKQLC